MNVAQLEKAKGLIEEIQKLVKEHPEGSMDVTTAATALREAILKQLKSEVWSEYNSKKDG